METFSIWWFFFFFALTYVVWLLYVLFTEGPEGIFKRKSKDTFVAAKAEEAKAQGGGAEPRLEYARVEDPTPLPEPKLLAFKPGFRDMSWGDPPKPAMSVLSEDGDEAVYMRATDKMRLGQGELVRIHYQFWGGKFAGAVLQVAPGNLEKVLAELTTRYGRPSQPKDNKAKYYWLSVGSGDGATQVVVDADLVKQSGTAFILSKALMEARKGATG